MREDRYWARWPRGQTGGRRWSLSGQTLSGALYYRQVSLFRIEKDSNAPMHHFRSPRYVPPARMLAAVVRYSFLGGASGHPHVFGRSRQ